MTYLQIVNKVLIRLRERTVSSVSQTTYSTMVGEFVNDAKRDVENAWDWGALRDIVTVTTADGTSTYALTGFGQEGKILSAWNDTSNRNMYSRSQAWFDRKNYGGETVSGSPYLYTFRGEDSSDDAQLELWPVPDGVYSLKLNCKVPQAELSDDADVLTIPWRPVVLQAVAMLAEEKGETDGTSSLRYFKMADAAISDAIAIDANRYPLELQFVEV